MRKIWNTVLKGLVAILPVGLTIYVVYWLAVTAERLFTPFIKAIIPDSLYFPGLGLLTGVSSFSVTADRDRLTMQIRTARRTDLPSQYLFESVLSMRNN